MMNLWVECDAIGVIFQAVRDDGRDGVDRS